MTEFNEQRTMMDFGDDDDVPADADAPGPAQLFQDQKTLMGADDDGDADADADAPGPAQLFQSEKTLMDADDDGGAPPPPAPDAAGFQFEKTFMDFGDEPAAPPPEAPEPSGPGTLEGDPDAPGPSFQGDVTFMDFADDDKGAAAAVAAPPARPAPAAPRAQEVPFDALTLPSAPPADEPPRAAPRAVRPAALADLEATKRLEPGQAGAVVREGVAITPWRLAPPAASARGDAEPPRLDLGAAWPFVDGAAIVTHFGARAGIAYRSGEDATTVARVADVVRKGGWPVGLVTLAEVCAETALDVTRAARALRELAEAQRVVFVEVPGGAREACYAVSCETAAS